MRGRRTEGRGEERRMGGEGRGGQKRKEVERESIFLRPRLRIGPISLLPHSIGQNRFKKRGNTLYLSMVQTAKSYCRGC